MIFDAVDDLVRVVVVSVLIYAWVVVLLRGHQRAGEPSMVAAARRPA